MKPFRARIRMLLPPPLLLVLFLLFDLGTSGPNMLDLHRLMDRPVLSVTALVTGGLSLYLVIAGLLRLVCNHTTINALHPARTTTLITDGCYAFSRNPVYLGFVGIQLSVAMLSGSTLGLLISPLLMVLISLLHIQPEEEEIARRFGEQWKRYREQTPRWLTWRLRFGRSR
ncbi:methyltransferase family protein [Leclercia adecarboxylata]|uniref:methyltransferase family protein n=1 Tax=Leclercia adecarboxylata TaxID=83655 RepID=UPI00254A88A8|nr:isoprenylcysteine carboxylmethyltransferase family protein [Leclercia adecarboxylata]